MEIKNNFNPLDPYARTQISGVENRANLRSANQTAAPTETGDRVSLSPEAKLRTEAFTSAMSAPETRHNKIAELKARVESGEYMPDSKAIASKLLSEEPGLFKA